MNELVTVDDACIRQFLWTNLPESPRQEWTPFFMNIPQGTARQIRGYLGETLGEQRQQLSSASDIKKFTISGLDYNLESVAESHYAHQAGYPMVCCLVCREALFKDELEGHCRLSTRHRRNVSQLQDNQLNVERKLIMLGRNAAKYQDRIDKLNVDQWRDELRGKLFPAQDLNHHQDDLDIPNIEADLCQYEQTDMLARATSCRSEVVCRRKNAR